MAEFTNKQRIKKKSFIFVNIFSISQTIVLNLINFYYLGMDIDRTIELIYSKTLILLDRLDVLRHENQRLKEELNQKKEELIMINKIVDEKDQEITSIKEELDTLSVSNALKNNKVQEDSKVKEKISHLITEVDKCINLLSN